MGDTNRSFYYGAAIAARPWKYYGHMFTRHLGIDVYAGNETVQTFAYTFPFNFNAP